MNINKPKDPEKKMKPSLPGFNCLRRRGLIFVIWKRSSLFGFNLHCLIFVVWVWSFVFGNDLYGLIFLEPLLFLLYCDLHGFFVSSSWIWSSFLCGFDLHGSWILLGFVVSSSWVWSLFLYRFDLHGLLGLIFVSLCFWSSWFVIFVWVVLHGL